MPTEHLDPLSKIAGCCLHVKNLDAHRKTRLHYSTVETEWFVSKGLVPIVKIPNTRRDIIYRARNKLKLRVEVVVLSKETLLLLGKEKDLQKWAWII